MLTYLTSYLCRPKHTMSELMKNLCKDIGGQMHSIGNIILTKHEVSAHEAVTRILSLTMRHSNINVLYIPTDLKKNSTSMLKSILEKMHPDDANLFAYNIINKYEIDQTTYIHCA